MRKCRDCCEIKPLEDFYIVTARNQHDYYCKPCRCFRAKKSRENPVSKYGKRKDQYMIKTVNQKPRGNKSLLEMATWSAKAQHNFISKFTKE
jgi:hypothetical protein